MGLSVFQCGFDVCDAISLTEQSKLFGTIVRLALDWQSVSAED